MTTVIQNAQYFFRESFTFDRMKKVRRQLTLFVDEYDAGIIEQIRMEYNPVQYGLIKSHVTLCREEELEQADKILEQLPQLDHGPVMINFGPIERFSGGKGLWLPGTGDNEQFHSLRKHILQGEDDVKRTVPHITLIHPRNADCTDTIFETIKKTDLPQQLLFNNISLVEQENEVGWKTISVFKL